MPGPGTGPRPGGWEALVYTSPNLFDVTVPLTSLFISHGTLDLAVQYLTVPLTALSISHGTPWGKHLFFQLIYFLIISYVRDKSVYCCSVSVYALINDVILIIYFLFLHLAVSVPGRQPTAQLPSNTTIRSRPTAYSTFTVQHNNLNRKIIIHNKKV
jgi:hypothetical protein